MNAPDSQRDVVYPDVLLHGAAEWIPGHVIAAREGGMAKEEAGNANGSGTTEGAGVQ